MTVQEWLGEDNKLGIDIWEKKYRYNNESFDEWLDRVSNYDNDVKQLIIDKKFLFGGRILSNRGLSKLNKKVSYSNCYVITPPEDNIESIFDCAKKLARTYSYGGGCGVDISNLAPKGAKVNNAANETTGSVSFMDLYSLTTQLIGQNGRRGALMLSIDCHHPDLEDFINVKNDLSKVTKANISIRITKDFMEAVKNNKNFELSFTRKETGEVIKKTVKARELFYKIAENNWNMGEPGFLLWDRIEKWNLLSEFDNFKYAGTNPCLVGDTLIQTTEGLIPIKDLVGTKPYVYCMEENGKLTTRQATKVWKTRENAELVTVETYRGSITCTPDHLIHTRSRGWVKACELRLEEEIIALRNEIFLDEIRKVKNVVKLEKTEDVYDMTVPEVHNFIANGMVVHNCAEEPLPAGGSCLLGSMNLSAFVKENRDFDYVSFREAVRIAVIALNNVLDEGLELHPLKEQQKSVRDWRQIGLGIFGLADMLIKMEIKYGSDESLYLCDKIAKELINMAISTSAMLAEKNGVFPKYNKENIFKSKFFMENTDKLTRMNVDKFGLRNSQLLTIAPTGSLSSMIGVSGGIEPIFANYYTRKTESLKGKDEYYKVYTPIVKKYMEDHTYIKDENDLPNWFVTSSDIPIKNRIKMQAVWQKHIDASISSTVNLPNSATVEDVENIYLSAYEHGLKGITVFREGCRRSGILTTQNSKSVEKHDKKDGSYSTLNQQSVEKNTNKSVISKEDGEFTVGFPRGMIERVPKGLDYRKYKLKTGCGSLYLFVGLDEDKGKIYDVFTNTDGVGGCPINTQAVSRLISACMRGGVPIEYIIEQLNKSGTCPSFQFQRGKGEKLSNGKSCPSAIACVLRDIVKELKDLDEDEPVMQTEVSNEPPKVEYIKMVQEPSTEIKNIANGGGCPECGGEIRHEGGCLTCPNCGWSKCS